METGLTSPCILLLGSRGGGMGVAEIEGDKVSSPAVRPSAAARECFLATLRRLSLAAVVALPGRGRAA